MTIYKFRNKIENAEQEKVGLHSINVVDSPKRLNNPSLRFELRQGEIFSGGGARSEIKFPRTKIGSEWEGGFSVFFDPSCKDNFLNSPDWLIFFQLHDQFDSGGVETWRHPFFLFGFKNGKLIAESRYDTNKITKPAPNSTEVARPRFILGDPVFGQWIDFTYRIKQFADNRGLLQAWMNGKKVIDIQNEPVCYNDDVGGFAKTGIYTKDTQKKPLILYIAELTLMDGGGHFSDVDVRTRAGVVTESNTTIPPEIKKTIISFELEGHVDVVPKISYK